MSNLAHPVEQNFLELRAFGLDDDPSDLKEVQTILRRYGFQDKVTNLVKSYGRMIAEVTQDDILISDNNYETLNDLSILSHPDIDTDGGTAAGLQILTRYHDEVGANSGLRIVISQFPFGKRVEAQLRRLRNNGKEIYAFHKNDPEELARIDDLIAKFRDKRYKEFIMAKYRYVVDLFDEWELSESERNILFGVSDPEDPLLEAIDKGTGSRDVEARCDLIHRMKVNLERIYGGNDPEQEAMWLRTPIEPLGEQSPIDFVRDGYQHKLAELVFRMEGP